jgi:D-alanine--poly(phosphoribitol) ligase subunit 2
MALDEARLVQYLRQKTGIDGLDAETLLFSDGTVDSVGMVDLIVFIESETGFEIRQEDVTLENFDNISRILGFVAARAVE